jgi:hypothetical protein
LHLAIELTLTHSLPISVNNPTIVILLLFPLLFIAFSLLFSS